MASEYEVVAVDHVGGAGDDDGPQCSSEWKTLRVVFHNFAELAQKRGQCHKSNVLECHGLRWRFDIFPGGHAKSSKDEVFVSTVLACVSCSKTTKIKARWKTRVPSAGKWHRSNWCVFAKNGGVNNEFATFGNFDFVKRSDVLDASKNYLVGGHLTVDVDIQVMLDKPPTWTPTNTISSDMLEFLDAADADNSDVVFEVSETPKKTTKGKKGKKKSYPRVFYAHRAILLARCPTLAALADDCSPGTPIPIEDVEPGMFRVLLRFIYGGEVPSTDALKSEGRSIIRAADKYGCTGLKLAAEAGLASAGITTENAAELILFAGATNCAMLKEGAMDYFIKNAQDVMASEGFEQVKESPAVMAELMAVGFCGNKKRPASALADDDRDYKRMRVATLRQKLDDKKLDVDGSKEMLISRLEAADAEAEAAAQAEAEENNIDDDEI